jgi:hypothetical protein
LGKQLYTTSFKTSIIGFCKYSVDEETGTFHQVNGSISIQLGILLVSDSVQIGILLILVIG